MNLYNSIPVFAAQLGITHDEVLLVLVLSMLSLLAILSFGVSFSMDIGENLYKLLKRFVFWIFSKAKKKEP